MKRKLPTWLTSRKRNRLLDQEMTRRDRAIVALFLFCGLRSNELRMLDVEDLDLDEGTVFVRHAKRDKERIVPLHVEARKALQEYLGDRRSGPVVLSNRGLRISNRRLRSLIKEMGSHADLRSELHPHALRHTFAVSLLEADVDLHTIKDLMGHESIETTSIYLHCTTERKRAAIDRL